MLLTDFIYFQMHYMVTNNWNNKYPSNRDTLLHFQSAMTSSLGKSDDAIVIFSKVNHVWNILSGFMRFLKVITTKKSDIVKYMKKVTVGRIFDDVIKKC